MAYYFVDGFEVRIVGVGIFIYNFILIGFVSVFDILRVYYMFFVICFFKKLLNFFFNRIIMVVVEKVIRIYIIDFGMVYGF